MAKNTVFSTMVGATRRTYTTNAPKDVVSRCYDNDITKPQFIERIESQGYTVSYFEADLYLSFKPED